MIPHPLNCQCRECRVLAQATIEPSGYCGTHGLHGRPVCPACWRAAGLGALADAPRRPDPQTYAEPWRAVYKALEARVARLEALAEPGRRYESQVAAWGRREPCPQTEDA